MGRCSCWSTWSRHLSRNKQVGWSDQPCVLLARGSTLSLSVVLITVEAGLTHVVWSEQLFWFMVLIRKFWSRSGLCQTLLVAFCIPCPFSCFLIFLFAILLSLSPSSLLPNKKRSPNNFLPLNLGLLHLCSNILFLLPLLKESWLSVVLQIWLPYILFNIASSASQKSPSTLKVPFNCLWLSGCFWCNSPLTTWEMQPSLMVLSVTSSSYSCHVLQFFLPFSGSWTSGPHHALVIFLQPGFSHFLSLDSKCSLFPGRANTSQYASIFTGSTLYK